MKHETDSADSNERFVDWSLNPSELESAEEADLPAGVKQARRHFESMPPFSLPLPATLGDYTLERRVGEGGMGIVFWGRHCETNQAFAIKLLKPWYIHHPAAWSRFRKEAQVWQTIRSPDIVECFGLEIADGQPFLVCEWISGVNLAQAVSQWGRLPESLVLRIFQAISRALATLHRVGVVHRDVKPENVLLELGEKRAKTCRPRDVRCVKLNDLGIARPLNQRPSLNLTAPYSFLGTPRFMAPEQFGGGQQVSTSADLYALGATIYFCLTGRPPFNSDNLWELAHCHREIPPPDPQAICPHISDGMRTLLLRLLRKEPRERYLSAEEVLQDIDRLQQGEPLNWPGESGNEVPSGALTFEFRWQLKCSPDRLWPWISQTNLFNRALGLPAPQFTAPDRAQSLRREAKTSLGGLPLHWFEYPFRWIQPHYMAVHRDFTQGPYHHVSSEVELAPRLGGGSILVHRLRCHCRNRFARWFARWHLGFRTARQLDVLYRRLDETASLNPTHELTTAAYALRPVWSSGGLRRWSEVIRRLAGCCSMVSLLTRLEQWIKEAPDDEVNRIRVRVLARRWQVDEFELLSMLLRACLLGGLELFWAILCPRCQTETFRVNRLKQVRDHASCEFCGELFRVDFAAHVELIFSVAPSIRKVSQQTWCVGGPYHAPHVAAQLCLAPHSKSSHALKLPPGDYLIRSPQLPQHHSLRVLSRGDNRHARLVLADRGCSSKNIALGPPPQFLELVNESSSTLLVRIEQGASSQDVLTAAEALANPAFRQMFPSEAMTPDDLMVVHQMWILAVIGGKRNRPLGAADSTPLTITPALRLCCAAIREVQARQGAIHWSGDAWVAVFRCLPSAAQCIERIQGILTSNQQFCEDELWQLYLHRGPVMISYVLGYPTLLSPTAAELPDALSWVRSARSTPRASLKVSIEASSDPECAAWMGPLLSQPGGAL